MKWVIFMMHNISAQDRCSFGNTSGFEDLISRFQSHLSTEIVKGGYCHCCSVPTPTAVVASTAEFSDFGDYFREQFQKTGSRLLGSLKRI